MFVKKWLLMNLNIMPMMRMDLGNIAWIMGKME